MSDNARAAGENRLPAEAQPGSDNDKVVVMEVVYFCDESGNTGGNYLDPTQPFYITAAIAVPDHQVDECRSCVQRYIDRSQARELKGTSLVASGRGRRAAAELLRMLTERGGIPFFVAVEKTYGLAAWFVNQFLDTDASGNVRLKYNVDAHVMRKAAADIAVLPPDVLQLVYETVKKPTVENQKEASAAVSEALRNARVFELADDLASSELPALYLADQDFDDYPSRQSGMTPNVNAFLTLLANAEKFARYVGATGARIVHDETSTFENHLVQHMGRVTDPESYERMRVWLEAHGYPRLDLVRSAEFVTSPSEPLVQVADIIGASVVYMLTMARDGSSPEPYDYELMRALFAMRAAQDDNHRPFTWWITSGALDKSVDRYLTELGRIGPTRARRN